jgi:hypothetical protein
MKRPRGEVKKERKKIIAVTARQHPSETVGSFAVEGLLRFLVSNNH